MIVYVDILFIKEFLINFAIIHLTKKISEQRVSGIKIIFVSSLASLYTIICLVYPIKYIRTGRIICIIIIILTTFKCGNIMEFIKINIIFYIISFIIAGIYMYTYDDNIKSIVYILGVLTFSSWVVNEYKKKYKISNYLLKLEMTINYKKYKLRALLDTGNELVSNLNEDVIIISPKIIKNMEDEYIKRLLIDSCPTKNVEQKIRIIKFKSLGNECDVKFGILVKDIKIKSEEGENIKSAVIIAADNNFDSYDAIVGLNFIDHKKRKEEEKIKMQ